MNLTLAKPQKTTHKTTLPLWGKGKTSSQKLHWQVHSSNTVAEGRRRTNQVRKRDGERSPEGILCAMLGELWNEANTERLLTQFMHIAKAIKFQHSCAYIHLPLKSGRGCYSWFVRQSYSVLSIKLSHTGKDSILCKPVKMQLACMRYLTHVHINAQSCMKHNVKQQKKRFSGSF